ncbi:MAG: hypothetical protein QOI71_3997 [Gaiellales bacterium]|nr:hypothetical protein [Gaiellales bacterium]
MVVADEHSVFRSGVVALLEREADMRAVPAASTEELIDVVDRYQPAVVLVDVDLAPAGGIEAIARIKRRAPETEAIAIATAPSAELVLAIVRVDARGIVERGVHSASLARIVRCAAAGEVTLPRRHLGHVLDELTQAERRFDANNALRLLTSREREVLALIEQGSRDREIGEALSISEFTVKRHVHNLLTKLEVPTRAAAISVALAAERTLFDGTLPARAT